MKYLTTMNLPAPGSSEFHESLKHYEGKPVQAIEDFEKAIKTNEKNQQP